MIVSYVMDVNENVWIYYISLKSDKPNLFSMLANYEPVVCAEEMIIAYLVSQDSFKLKYINNCSGHYSPKKECLDLVLQKAENIFGDVN